MNLLLKSRNSNVSRPILKSIPIFKLMSHQLFSSYCNQFTSQFAMKHARYESLHYLYSTNLLLRLQVGVVAKGRMRKVPKWRNTKMWTISHVWIRDRVLFPCDMTLLSFESKSSVISKHPCVNVTESYLILSKHNYVTVGSWIWCQQVSPALISKATCSGFKSLKGSWNTMLPERNGVSQEISAAFVTVVM